MCDSVVSEDPYLIVHCPEKYKSQRMYDEAVDNCPPALKFIPYWFVTRKILDNALHANDDILFYNEDFDKAIFVTNQRHILAVDLLILIMKIIFMKMIQILSFMSDFWLCVVNLKNGKHLKKR